ncbi:hypothetical protein BBK36DRAFT_1172152 [Trichoderma citrinoviride]|uniref:Protection of telomeres protein 1 n=1 Tax=Trichoderma citrinoviride TaxID=58853 RepID=A0A2T4B0N9_9HYPO|nr:hypothetical protein BBK36DRAFT_1172152 [Trichoderma citrinoviride]PTB62860.1 hypothetical protein BBK36DRAFT_1172152 [Trichoderma citrinoviride]
MAPHVNKRQNSLPSGFITVRDILDRKRGVGNLLNVIGVVKDFRTPVPTRGTDWKCEIKLFDRSIEDASFDAITINIFRPESEMPSPNVGDVIVLYQAKLQSHANELSLVTHRTTDIHLYSSSEIPRPSEGALQALRPLSRKTAHSPGQVVHEYVSHLYHSIDKSSLPTEAEFQDMKAKSAIHTGKSKELKDVRDGTFADVVVQLVRQPYDTGDRVTLWVSDYTENDHFFHFTYKGLDALQGQDSYIASLPYGAGAGGGGGGGEWKGPFGKRSMQVTCYDPHTSVIREQGLSAGSWVLLRNLQIKFGRNAANLEGFLREDRGSSSQKINIQQMDVRDTDAPDPRLKEAIRRKRDYEREKRDRLKDLSDAAIAGQKRKSQLVEMEPASSDKSKKSKKTRQRNKKKSIGQDEPSVVPATAPAPTTLTHVKCENEDKAISTIDSILEPMYLETDIKGQQVKLRLPFVNKNYRAHVRVVNFMPPDLEDFARPRRATEYDMLSDNEEPDQDGSESGGESAADDTATRVWEWQFFLELEDASPHAINQGERRTIWVAVNNFSAQCLVNMDASDLRKNQHELETLRHRLSLLWGELEEKKTLERENRRRRRRAALANRGANQPPSHSSDDDERGAAAQMQVDDEPPVTQVRTMPFACCIRQYGVEVPEEDPRKADAGEGKRWQRMFGLFGTRIAYD